MARKTAAVDPAAMLARLQPVLSRLQQGPAHNHMPVPLRSPLWDKYSEKCAKACF